MAIGTTTIYGSADVPEPSTDWQHPPSFYCPISQQVMHDPVVVSDGHTYERRHIERWLLEHNTSPVSNEELPVKTVFPNHAMRNAITEYFDQIVSAHRRAIRKKALVEGQQQLPGSNEPLLETIDALMQCSLLMNADMSAECVLKQIMNEAKQLLGAEAASVFLVDGKKQELYSKINSAGREICIPMASGIAGHVASTGEPLLIPDAYADHRFNKSNDLKTGFRTQSMLCVPLRLKRGEIIGVVQLINKSTTGVSGRKNSASSSMDMSECSSSQPSFTAYDMQFLQVFATQAATAVTNSGGISRDEAESEPSKPQRQACTTNNFECLKQAVSLSTGSDGDETATLKTQNSDCAQMPVKPHQKSGPNDQLTLILQHAAEGCRTVSAFVRAKDHDSVEAALVEIVFIHVVQPLLCSLAQVAPVVKPVMHAAAVLCNDWEESVCQNLSKRSSSSTEGHVRENLPSDDCGTDTLTQAPAEERLPSKKKSGRSRQRAAKYWASARCRTPSPERSWETHDALVSGAASL